MNSNVVFDITNKHADLSATITGSLIFVFGLFAIWIQKRRPAKIAVPRIGYAMCAVALVLVAYDLLGSRLELAEHIKALKTGNFSVVEGRVQGFHPMPKSGHELESFSLSGRRFSYSDFVANPCFNNTASHGGPIREGLHVQISYSGDCILRIELLDDSPTPH